MAGRPRTAVPAEYAKVIEEGDTPTTTMTNAIDMDNVVEDYESRRIARQAVLTAKLAERVPDSELRTRKGANNMDLTYISADYVIRKANEIFGPFGWSSKVDNIECNFVSGVAIARVTVAADNGEHSGVGTGTASNRNGAPTPEQWEMAIKGAESDALKRAFVNFGDAFGLFLREKGESTGGGGGSYAGNGPTDGQRKFIETLIGQNPSRAALIPAGMETLTVPEVSAIIDQMKMMRSDEGTPRTPAATAPRENTSGGKASERQVTAITGMFKRLVEVDEDAAVSITQANNVTVEFPSDMSTPELGDDLGDLTVAGASDFFKALKTELDALG